MKPIYLASPNFDLQNLESVMSVLKSGNLVQGINVNSLEIELSNLIEVNFASALSNGTATLHLALVALGVSEGDEVILPAFSYIATANAVELVGAKPVFTDIDLQTFNIDTTIIEEKINNDSKCILPVHEFGLCSDMINIMSIAGKHGIKVIEDAACALGARIGNKYAGTWGDFGSFSLHPRKAITSGEGGILVTHDPLLDHEIKVLRNHGFDSYLNDFTRAGFNYRMTDFQAALVLSQLPRLNDFLKRKGAIAEYYNDNLNQDLLSLPKVPEGFEHSWQTYHVLLPTNSERDKFRKYLSNHNIFTNYGAQCMPVMKYYKSKYGYKESNFPNAFRAYETGLALPVHENLTDLEIEYIVQTVNKY